jgi:hypothetical protein
MIIPTDFPTIYCISGERNSVQAARDVMRAAGIERYWSRWNPEGCLWVVFLNESDAVLFRLRFADEPMVLGDCHGESEATFLSVSLWMTDDVVDWVEENGFQDRVGWFERVQILFSTRRARKRFEAALDEDE